MSPLPLILESKNFSGSLSPILLQGPGFLLSLFLSEEILLDLQHPGEAVHQGGFSTALFSSLTRLPPPLSIGFSRSGSQSFVCFNSRVLHICLPFCHPTHTHMLFPCHHTRGSSTQAFCIILQPRIWVNKEAFPLHFPPGPHWFTQTGGVTPCSWVILKPLLQHFELTLYQQPKEPLCKVQLGSDEPMLKENEKEIQRLCKADMLFVFIDFLCGCSAVQWRCGTFPEQAGLTHVTWLGHIFEPCDARGDGDIATLHGKANLVCFSGEPGARLRERCSCLGQCLVTTRANSDVLDACNRSAADVWEVLQSTPSEDSFTTARWCCEALDDHKLHFYLVQAKVHSSLGPAVGPSVPCEARKAPIGHTVPELVVPESKVLVKTLQLMKFCAGSGDIS